MTNAIPATPVHRPATPPAPDGPSPQASPRAHEAFEKHLDRAAHGSSETGACKGGGSAEVLAEASPGLAIASSTREDTHATGSAAGADAAPAPAAAPSAGGAGAAPAAGAGPSAATAAASSAPASSAPAGSALAADAPAPAASTGPAPAAPAPAAPAAAPAPAPAPALGGSAPAPPAPAAPEAGPLPAPPQQPTPPAASAHAATPASPATPAAPAVPATPATPATPARPRVADPPAAEPAATTQPDATRGGSRTDRIPGPPPHAAAWQHASPPAHASSALAGPLSTPPAPAPPAGARPGVLLAHAAETLRLTISAANAQGISRARIALRPAELGGVEIMLAHGPTGLSATVTADSAPAAQALQKAADELQRTLAQQGLQLVSLQIDVAADGREAHRREDRGASADDRGAGHAAGAGETGEPAAPRTIELSNGALVDVLA